MFIVAPKGLQNLLFANMKFCYKCLLIGDFRKGKRKKKQSKNKKNKTNSYRNSYRKKKSIIFATT